MKERNFVKCETQIKAQRSMVYINDSSFLHICYDLIPSCISSRCNLLVFLYFEVDLGCVRKDQTSIHTPITDFKKNRVIFQI